MTHIDRRSLSLLGLATMLSPASAFAADYPTRPIHLIVGFTPGASSDIVARLYAKGAGSVVGQEMVVENKTGAGSSIAAGFVARASSDGYTLLVPALSTLTYKIVHPEVSFDMTKDFAPVALLASGPLVMAVDPKLGVNSVKEFTALANSLAKSFSARSGPAVCPIFAASFTRSAPASSWCRCHIPAARRSRPI
jgi:tripartite-type tricarboxylate transporter receptor subunit TctC